MITYAVRISLIFTLAMALPAFAQISSAIPPNRRINITIDDLPWVSGNDQSWEDENSLAARSIKKHHHRLISAMKKAKAQVTGFVNESKLYSNGHKQKNRIAILDDWLKAGFELGNHTYGHVSMHHVELHAYKENILIAGIRARGYQFVSLEEAIRDPAYQRGDTFTGRYGPSWLHRWALADKKPKAFYEGEPVVPKWVLQLAEVESE